MTRSPQQVLAQTLNPTFGRSLLQIHQRLGAAPQKFPSISLDGRAVVVTTTGNPHCHLVLRGANDRPNYDVESVRAGVDALTQAGLPPRLMVDCSHGNSGKDYLRQPSVAADVASQIGGGSRAIRGLMLESHLIEGRQEIVNGRQGLRYGQSVTDAYIAWETTVEALEQLAATVRSVKPNAVEWKREPTGGDSG